MSIHQEKPIDKNLRDFGIKFGGAIGILFGIIYPWVSTQIFPIWPWFILIVLWILSFAVPRWLGAVYKIWMKLGLVISWVNTRILLGLIFYLVIFPTRIALFLCGKDPMFRKIDPNAASYRILVKKREKNHVERPF